MRFKDRAEAGRMLSEKLIPFKGSETVVFALPRGGVIVGREIAKALKVPLELIITRKIGHPNQPEFAIAAISEGGKMVGDPFRMPEVDPSWLEANIRKELEEAKRRRQAYKPKEKISPKDKTAIIVDDGAATGLTIMAAIKELSSKKPKKIILALPVAPLDVLEKLKKKVDEVVCINCEKDFLGAVGTYYEKFPQVEDTEVKKILEKN